MCFCRPSVYIFFPTGRHDGLIIGGINEGTGTFGQVRLCQQKATGKYFCLKILSKEKIVRLKQTEHVKSEKSVLAQISHPFIVKLYVFATDGFVLQVYCGIIPPCTDLLAWDAVMQLSKIKPISISYSNIYRVESCSLAFGGTNGCPTTQAVSMQQRLCSPFAICIASKLPIATSSPKTCFSIVKGTLSFQTLALLK